MNRSTASTILWRPSVNPPPGGGKASHSLTSIPTPAQKRRKKAARVYDTQPDIPEQRTENQGSDEVPHLVSGRFDQWTGQRSQWHGPGTVQCRSHWRSTGGHRGGGEDGDGGFTPTGHLGDTDGWRLPQIRANVDLQDPEICLEEGGTTLQRLLVLRLHQRHVSALIYERSEQRRGGRG